ncbi:MAG TPA: ATP-binding protein [Thermomicrobiales bacterium]|nr:ATP-binding protein [Thermomicrobiales bacterium]
MRCSLEARGLLLKLPMFAGLSEDEIQHFLDRAYEVDIGAGETLFREGDPPDAVYIIIDGVVEVVRDDDNRTVLLYERGSGEVIGEMAPLFNEPRAATIRARTHVKLVKVETTDFLDVLSRIPSIAVTILRTAARRMRDLETQLALNQRMAGLGTLSAGLAHELNNPASAVQRSASQLGDAFRQWQALTLDAPAGAVSPEAQALLDRLLDAAIDSSRDSGLAPLERSRREESVEAWLEQRGVDRPWELAATLVDLGLHAPSLEEIAAVEPGRLSWTLWWLATIATINRLLAELSASAASISSIVSAVRSYTYLGQSPVQEVDVHDGIEQTLLILRNKLRPIRVHREFTPDLPHITAWASELNQVWTNIIANAVDAMDGEGDLTIRTSRDGEWVEVQIEDSGPGIPPENRDRLFEPFYTTKPQGQGTGLGLHISYNIVVQKHRGNIQVRSRPGQTRFFVTLPISRPE